MAGDELILRHTGDESHAPFESSGVVTRLSASEEIGLELKNGGNAPIDLHGGYSVDVVWKSVAYDRMQVRALSCCSPLSEGKARRKLASLACSRLSFRA